MKKVYKDQDLRLIIPTVENVSAATVTVKARKPDGEAAEYTPTTAADGLSVHIDFEPDQAGRWAFWLYVVWPDTKRTPSNPVELYVNIEGER
jgi:hypothetical protein